MLTIPNLLTMLRVALIPIFVVVYFLDWKWAHQMGAFIFWFAAITDWFDGYLARKLKQMSPFGAFLDPVADKLIVAAALLMITDTYASPWITIPAVLLMAREIFISALREWMAIHGQSDTVKVSFWGKAKTMAQMLALIGLLSELEHLPIGEVVIPLYWQTLGFILLYIATVLSVFSMVQYIVAAKQFLLNPIYQRKE
ncbi:CDP-diacylglycerol--glycerol-3-phosphate 3-phosphatidyltransferase [Alteromonas sp. a30]|uniref:CDP-diacylglycerol--glycerol-3-phosphate 3-phosphatidyltransferase n=1 Tax=Alteromonas sp. a30 TaxID=2730917 RepID=UPI00228045C3|nr:CDP-diacylglycerol--glycerol-3-phosphate 3-phosphatidyltransferase [Alteromonas sp. a30]MCY7295081.1 CDP-diacylglycerol--glycerol-3-phosphate 3-phosphatidyltransferase [Alteromonas sp. a30]